VDLDQIVRAGLLEGFEYRHKIARCSAHLIDGALHAELLVI
jgi:hypothetical protein